MRLLSKLRRLRTPEPVPRNTGAPADDRRSGATLLVTLGVLSVLSVMVVTYLLTMRHQRLSAKHYRDSAVARQALDIALMRAMQFADGALIASNYILRSSASLTPENNYYRRVAPVNAWYRPDYQPDSESRITDEADYQDRDILAVPVIEEDEAGTFETNALTVNLLTEEVCRLLPAALTNRFSGNPKLQSGWIDLGNDTRISFAVLNTSGFPDAHTYDFENGVMLPATQTYARAYFSQQDLNNNPERQPEELEDKTVLSFDPGPATVPFYPGSSHVQHRLGYRDFTVTNKFCLNDLTNFFDAASDPAYARVRVTPDFEQRWLRPVSNQLNAAQSSGDVFLGDPAKVAWNIAAYLSPSRVPMISFPGIALASRADYGIEAVPLINEVSVFNCVGENGRSLDQFEARIQDIAVQLRNHYEQEVQKMYPDGSMTLAPITMSNVYAAAVELWYPFVPKPVIDPNIPDGLRVYLGVSTNRGDLMTTTNSNWTARDLADWYGLDDPYVAELEAYVWNDLYEEDATAVTNSLFWQLVTPYPLVTSVIQEPELLTDTNLLAFSEGLAVGYVYVYVDPATGLIPTNNPYAALIRDYAPASTNLTPEEAESYYSTPANYVPVVVTALTNRVEDETHYDGGGIADNKQQIMQRYLPAQKSQVGPFGNLFNKTLETSDFNAHGFAAVTNDIDLAYFTVLEPRSDEKKCYVLFLPLGQNVNLWVRPVVAVNEQSKYAAPENDGFEPVDEALLEDDNQVLTWPASHPYRTEDGRDEYCLSVNDPRDNAYSSAKHSAWYSAPNSFGAANRRNTAADGAGAESSGSEEDDASGATDRIPGVAELPFVHFDSPFQTIGELGYITADLDAKAYNRQHHLHPLDQVRDTVDFSTRTGAALLDLFTLAPTNSPMRGLVQANTTYDTVIRNLLGNVPLGWTNRLDDASHLQALTDTRLALMAECWTNTLFKVYDTTWDRRSGTPGWRCFAEMLPDLSTNVAKHAEAVYSGLESDPFYRHDYVEDVMRGFIDYVSFRQNVFMVVVAAQTLSPASTPKSPVVLSDQRAAVTVLRDAYTGRWLIHSWVWLTE